MSICSDQRQFSCLHWIDHYKFSFQPVGILCCCIEPLKVVLGFLVFDLVYICPCIWMMLVILTTTLLWCYFSVICLFISFIRVPYLSYTFLMNLMYSGGIGSVSTIWIVWFFFSFFFLIEKLFEITFYLFFKTDMRCDWVNSGNL